MNIADLIEEFFDEHKISYTPQQGSWIRYKTYQLPDRSSWDVTVDVNFDPAQISVYYWAGEWTYFDPINVLEPDFFDKLYKQIYEGYSLADAWYEANRF